MLSFLFFRFLPLFKKSYQYDLIFMWLCAYFYTHNVPCDKLKIGIEKTLKNKAFSDMPNAFDFSLFTFCQPAGFKAFSLLLFLLSLACSNAQSLQNLFEFPVSSIGALHFSQSLTFGSPLYSRQYNITSS